VNRARLHPQVQALLAELADSGAPADLATQRAAYAETARLLGGEPEPVAEVADLEIPGPGGPLAARAYRPAEATDADAAPAVLWLHGGGWIMGDLDGIDRVCRSLANAAGAVVVALDYRLAPEHPFPAAVEDTVAALAWMRDDGADGGAGAVGVDPARVVIGGDSAGGNLATVAALRTPGAVAGQLLVYPAVDGATNTASWRELADDPVLPAVSMRGMWRRYLGDADPLAPDASPLRADLTGAPPALVAVAGHDVLHDEGLAYAQALRTAGADVELLEYEDMPHGFLRWGGAVDRARELVAELGGFVRGRTGDAST
jgi:acetyl esterase